MSGPSVKKKTTVFNLDAEDSGDDDNGGCFGKGPGRIDIDTDFIDWDTTNFYAPAQTYEIIVRIDPPDRDPSWTGIQLVLLERSPPSITVVCQTGKLRGPFNNLEGFLGKNSLISQSLGEHSLISQFLGEY